MKEFATWTEGIDNSPVIHGVGQIAPRSSRHENLHTRFAVFLQKHGPSAPFRGRYGSQ